MSNFNVDDEINKAVDKLTEQFKIRLKKIVLRSEKIVLKKYIASQKDTSRVSNGTYNKREKRNNNSGSTAVTKKTMANKVQKNKVNYETSESDFSESDSE